MTQKEIITDYLRNNCSASNVKTAFDNFPRNNEFRFQHFKSVWNEINGLTTFRTEQIQPKQAKAYVPINLTHWTPKSENFQAELFETYLTHTGLDIILSVDGGVTKGSQIIITGEPGVGKTTVQAYMQYQLQKHYPTKKIVCVQTEMKKFDIGYEYAKNGMDWMGEVQYIILKGDDVESGDIGYERCKEKLEAIFTSGYDIIFLDSVADMVEKLKAFAGMKESEAENFLLGLMDNASDGKNNQGINTTTFAIQQITKGGEFKGDNKLKHMTTGMLHLMFDKKGDRYITFSKNRRCGGHVNKKLYFSLNQQKEVVFNIEAFNEAEAIASYAREQANKLKEHSQSFFEILANKGMADNLTGNKIDNLDSIFNSAFEESNKSSQNSLTQETVEEIDFEEMDTENIVSMGR